jgi:hypothetical protein
MFFKKKNKAEKSVNINTIYSNETGRQAISPFKQDIYRRGIQIYTTSQIVALTGRDKEGRLLTWGTEQPYFYLTADQRNQIFRLSSIIFGIVSSRMNRISNIDFNIVSKYKIEDKIADEMKDKRQIYVEYKNSLELNYLVLKANIYKELSKELQFLKPDLSNFDNCLLRWKKGIKRNLENSSDEIKDWLMQPNAGVTWQDYIKKAVFNLHIHGCESTYKQIQDGKLENFDSLPGGTVFKIKETYFSNISGFVQAIPGYEPQVFFDDEICYIEYLPTSIHSQGMIPLESLINMIAETLLFDGRMAEVADGTRPPEKMVIITNNSPFGDFDHPDQIPLNPSEQKRLETKFNEPRKNAIMTFSGNAVNVVDMSYDQKWEFHNLRKKDIREEAAMVYNMSNMEINLTGSEDTSGRNTSEAQSEIEQNKGIAPILKNIQVNLQNNLIPYRYGSGWYMEFVKEKNETIERQLDLIKLQTGEFTPNELREYRGQPIFIDEKYNLPKDSQPEQKGDNEMNPMFTKQIQ